MAVTAYAREEDKEQALKAGFQLHVSKPVGTIALIEILCKLVDQAAK
ncbi:MAG TPA: hypothetical protein VGI81_07250 [Tepidisphaeraceae bacterium]